MGRRPHQTGVPGTLWFGGAAFLPPAWTRALSAQRVTRLPLWMQSISCHDECRNGRCPSSTLCGTALQQGETDWDSHTLRPPWQKEWVPVHPNTFSEEKNWLHSISKPPPSVHQGPPDGSMAAATSCGWGGGGWPTELHTNQAWWKWAVGTGRHAFNNWVSVGLATRPRGEVGFGSLADGLGVSNAKETEWSR